MRDKNAELMCVKVGLWAVQPLRLRERAASGEAASHQLVTNPHSREWALAPNWLSSFPKLTTRFWHLLGFRARCLQSIAEERRTMYNEMELS